MNLDGIVKYIKEGKAKNVVVLAGAGISTGNQHSLQFRTRNKEKARIFSFWPISPQMNCSMSWLESEIAMRDMLL